MKNRILNFLLAAAMLIPGFTFAQSFSVAQDTARVSVSGVGTENPTDYIINHQNSSLTLKWQVTDTDFPTSWLGSATFGICDNHNCYTNNAPKWLWNPTFGVGFVFKSDPYADTTSYGPFHLSLTFAAAEVGTHYLVVTFTDTVTNYSKNMTFVITKVPAAVPTVKASSDMILYPNPANNELNVVYDAAADVKTIAVYNIIGKVMQVYRVSGNSANLNLENMSSGIYFMRLANSNGEVVATKKFSKL